MERITGSEYATEIEALAKGIRDEAKEYGRDLHDVLHETIDSHRWVIYTFHAREVLQHSDNDCAIFEEMGPQEWSDWSTAFSQAAYFAMLQDVSEALADLDDVDEP